MTLFSPKILSSLNSEIDSCALAVTLFVRDFDFLGFLSSFLELLQRYQTIPPIIMVANATWTPSLAFFLSTGIFLCPIIKDLIRVIKDLIAVIKDLIAFIKIFSKKPHLKFFIPLENQSASLDVLPASPTPVYLYTLLQR
jgi:hypothetical protein